MLVVSVGQQATNRVIISVTNVSTLNMVIIRYDVCAGARGTVVWSVVSGVQYSTV